jgi:DNA-binding NarL/FixJ family response regulator
MNRKVKIIFFTIHPDLNLAAEALRAGCSAYILKGSSVAEIREAVRQASGGRLYVTQSIEKALVQAKMERPEQQDQFRFKLTSRQREVLQLIVEGQSSKEIAEVLHLSRRTIEFHRYNIMKELSLRTTAELIQFAIKSGVVPT